MLVAESEFTLPGLEGVRLFGDDASPQGFYAIPDAPRLAVGPDGRPEVSVAAYGRRADGVFKPTGGVLTLTAVLDLGDELRARIRKLLAARLEEAGVKEPQPQLLAPEWMEAQVEARLAEGVQLTAAPSLAGDNRVSFNAKLTAPEVEALLAAVKDGLPQATLRYRGRLRASSGSSSAAYGSVLHAVRGPEQSAVTGVSGFSVQQAAGAGALEVDVAAPLAPGADLGSAVQTVEL